MTSDREGLRGQGGDQAERKAIPFLVCAPTAPQMASDRQGLKQPEDQTRSSLQQQMMRLCSLYIKVYPPGA